MPARIPSLLLAATVALAACQRAETPKTSEAPAPPGASELDWARAALERNPNLEVLATDAAAGVFTVRDRGSGDVRTVKLSELAATPVAALEAAVVSDAPVAEAEPGAQRADAAEATDAAEEPALDYPVERSGGQVRVSGPGVSIVSATAPAAASDAPETGPRTVDPIICDGERVMQVNDRRVTVTGDAITARNGCQLHVINSRVTATGTGIVIRDATVHITNSTIEGGSASFDAGAGARVFLQGATMKGQTRRADDAEVHEQGNNQWR
jgi:hypothetical protein